MAFIFLLVLWTSIGNFWYYTYLSMVVKILLDNLLGGGVEWLIFTISCTLDICF